MSLTVPVSFDGSVVGDEDDMAEEGDIEEDYGETMFVDLLKVRPGVVEIVFCVTIHNENPKEILTFKDIKDPRIVIIDQINGKELCSYNLKERFSTETAVVAGALLLNEDGDWEFEARGNSYDGGLQTLVDMYA